jgi:pimeloyl-ACP methyl ester carboxylesterase
MARRSLDDGAEPFEVTLLAPADPSRIVLFAVGGGGDPERQHAPLLAALAERGCLVVAPHFERLPAWPSEEALVGRARRLRLALASVGSGDLPVAGVGHSIGAMLLVALAGGQAWMGEGRPLAIEPPARVDRLALMAPAAGYFQAAGALDRVRAPVLAWAGSADSITPPAQVQVLARGGPFDLRVAEGAGHFSFMHTLPPQVTDPMPDREAFLDGLVGEIARFVTA